MTTNASIRDIVSAGSGLAKLAGTEQLNGSGALETGSSCPRLDINCRHDIVCKVTKSRIFLLLSTACTPRELRHSFVSIMGDNGVPIETIADLAGHASTSVTEMVYRHQLKPVITKGAETMNTIFNQHAEPKSA
jgi:hypothetical protein